MTKKRRTSDGSAPVSTTASRDEPSSVGGAKVNSENGNGQKDKATKARFKRVDPDKYKAHVIGENRYDAKVCWVWCPPSLWFTISRQDAPSNDYGKRAHQDLIVTRGAGFKKEKNKKKRGSYRGGEITVCPFISIFYLHCLTF